MIDKILNWLMSLVVIAACVVLITVCADYLSARESQRQAVMFCMQWGIPDAVMVDGTIYCVGEMTTYGEGESRTVSVAIVDFMMPKVFGEIVP